MRGEGINEGGSKQHQDNATITKVSENCYTKTSDDQKSVCYSSLDDVMLEYLNQHKKKAESRIPLCKHGIRYLAEKFSETLVSEGKVLVEFLPRSQLFSFANELRDLVKEVESLQISLLNNKHLTCQKAYCRWLLNLQLSPSNENILKRSLLRDIQMQLFITMRPK